MSIPTWPFKRQRSAGFIDDGTDIPSAPELTAIDEQLSRAANGLLWSDSALLKNFSLPVSFVGSPVNFPVYDRVNKMWFVASSLTPSSYKIFVSSDGAASWVAANVSVGYPNLSFNCSATDGEGRVAFGFTPQAASTTKIIYSDDGFATHHSAANIGAATGGLGVTALMYSARLGIWVAGLSDGSIYISPDLTIFALRFAGDGRPRTGFAESGDRIMSVHSSGGTTGCLTSTDGDIWTAITTPSLHGTSPAIGYVSGPEPGAFVLAHGSGAGDGRSAQSVDGSVWTPTVDASFPTDVESGVGYGRMMVVAARDSADAFDDLWYSLNAGVTWKRSGTFRLTGTAVYAVGLGDDQFLAISGNGTDALVYRGIRGGL